MFAISFKYSLFVFMAVTGVLQAAGSYNNLLGLSFFKHKLTGYLFALVTTGSALTAFFTWNSWLATGKIEGSQQFSLFILSTLLALIFTLMASSAVNHTRTKTVISPAEGIESLKKATIFRIWRKKARKESHV